MSLEARHNSDKRKSAKDFGFYCDHKKNKNIMLSMYQQQQQQPCNCSAGHDRRRPLDEGLKKEVRFCNRVLVFPVLHVTEYSTEERGATWYTNDEIRAIKQGNKEMLLQPTISGTTNSAGVSSRCDVHNEESSNVTYRGLESKTVMGGLRKHRHKKEAWKTVFIEQKRQITLGYKDPEAVANAYYEITESCQVAAHMLALRDAKEIQWLEFLGERFPNGQENPPLHHHQTTKCSVVANRHQEDQQTRSALQSRDQNQQLRAVTAV